MTSTALANCEGWSKLPTSNILSQSLVVFSFIFALVLIGATDGGLLRDPDAMWHIAVGRRILESGFPWTDELSHTFQGQQWIAKEWLSQVILALAHRLGGWSTVVAVAAAAIALTFSLMFAELRRQFRPAVALSIVLLAYAFCSIHFVARPHILSYPVIILWFAGLVRAVENKRQPSVLLLPLMTLWANLHAGFTLGLAIAGLLALEATFTSRPEQRRQTFVRWALFLGAATLATFITPYGFRPIFATTNILTHEHLAFVDEWRAMNFAKEMFGGPLIIGLIFFALLVGVKLRPMRLVIVTILFYSMLMHVRLASMFALVAPLMIAGSLRAQFPSLSSANTQQSLLLDKIVNGLKLRYAAAVFVLVPALPLVALYARDVAPPASIAPAAAVDHVLRTDQFGRVYNDFAFNGYLIFRGVKTFIDGRTDQLFGGGFTKRFFESPKALDDDFLKLLKEYGISTAIVRPGSPQAVKLDNAPGWRRAYADDVAVVYQRSQS